MEVQSRSDQYGRAATLFESSWMQEHVEMVVKSSVAGRGWLAGSMQDQCSGAENRSDTTGLYEPESKGRDKGRSAQAIVPRASVLGLYRFLSHVRRVSVSLDPGAAQCFTLFSESRA